MNYLRALTLGALLAVLFFGTISIDLHAQAASASTPHVESLDGSIRITWEGAVRQAEDGASSIEGWPLVDIGGARLPAHLFAVRLTSAEPVSVHISFVESAIWTGSVARVETLESRIEGGRVRAALAPPPPVTLPDGPLLILREGRLRGERIAVVAVSPIFMHGDDVRVATQIEATIPNARVMASGSPETFVPAMRLISDAPAPTNPAAARPAVKIIVAQGGLQRITGASLQAAGLDSASFDPDLVHVTGAGKSVRLEVRGGGDGRLDAQDEIRFYAPPPGDRWNSTDTYWLTLESTGGARMASRAALPAGAPPRATGMLRDTNSRPTLYDSRLAGPDRDHWFLAELRTGPGQAPMTVTVALTPGLPLTSGTTILTIAGTADTPGDHQLIVRAGGTQQPVTWGGRGDWSFPVTVTGRVDNVTLVLAPGASPDIVLVDRVSVTRPASLRLNGSGAAFHGVTGVWQYQVESAPAGAAVYDVSDPNNPTILSLQHETMLTFQDGPSAYDYVIAGPGTLHDPAVLAHEPVTLLTSVEAEALYIAPAEFHQALAPLVQHRRAQGLRVAVVDVQAIYDAWSYGQVSPAAIRAFLRYAAATSNAAPRSVTLVGDGSSDPRNYLGRNNRTFIPPYLVDAIDPWLGETACETCYGQLDGENPLDDPLPDVPVGRLPVKSEGELKALVEKLIAYETAPVAGWQARATYIADNYQDAEGNRDLGGDFAAFADLAASWQPEGVEIRRVYYDPWRKDEAGLPLDDPWRIPDALAATSATKAVLNEGAGLVTYVGHSYFWDWATTDTRVNPPHLLGMYDTDALTNHGRPFVLLEMTCLTAAFHEPAFSGTVLDERFLLAPGGAIAVWGPTGLGVAHGHDLLQQGFLDALWQNPKNAPLGSLTTAGYLELFSHGSCCQDTLRTFALLGDPLTPARLYAAERGYLPLIRR